MAARLPGFDERQILYTGGTACAILAGLHDRKEILEINRQFLAAAAQEKYATIGMTVYPPYPLAAFPDVPPYTYQNGGDWTWFGGRIIQALTANGFAQQAYKEMNPMIDRAIKNNGFFSGMMSKPTNPQVRGISGAKPGFYTMPLHNYDPGRQTRRNKIIRDRPFIMQLNGRRATNGINLPPVAPIYGRIVI